MTQHIAVQAADPFGSVPSPAARAASRRALLAGACRAALLTVAAASAGVSVVPAAQAQIVINTPQNAQQNLDVMCAGIGAGCTISVTANVVVPAATALAGNG